MLNSHFEVNANSNSDPSLSDGSVQESSTYFHHLSEFVNKINAECQLQNVKGFRSPQGSWALLFDLYPDARQTLLLVDDQENGVAGSKGSDFKAEASSHPLLLYLKAHFVGHRIESVTLLAQGFEWSFKGSERQARFELNGKNLKVKLRVPERKDYLVQIPLAQTKDFAFAGQSDAPKLSSTKEEKLRSKLEREVKEAREVLGWLGPLLRLIEEKKDLWAREEEIPPQYLETLKGLQRVKKLPSFGRSFVAQANEKLFHLRKRYEKKLSFVEKRLHKEGPLRLKKEKSIEKISQKERSLERKKPGLWVELEPDLWARVGRSATENDELFRQARDRDLWFHVRALAGAHVWIPRAQKALSSQGEAPERILELGRMLALYNSKARSSGAAEVDQTERRYLKKIPREAGKLKILRSKVVHTRLKAEFERKWGGK